MHQSGGLECLARLLLSKPHGSQLAELVIHQREQFLRRRRIAGFDMR
jgi:hypothetical protein